MLYCVSQVLETCMKTCGKRFHSEVGKFRFLNELIKVVSPKVMVCVCVCVHTGSTHTLSRALYGMTENGKC